MRAFSEFIIVGMAFCFIVSVSVWAGYSIGKKSISLEANTKIAEALKLGIEECH